MLAKQLKNKKSLRRGFVRRRTLPKWRSFCWIAFACLALASPLIFKAFASGETSSLQLNYSDQVNSINFTSALSRYGDDDVNDQGDQGAWKVEKEAHYIGDAKAKITFNISSRIKTNQQKKKDVVLVLDNSGSMEGKFLDQAKKDSIGLANSILSDKGNRIALVKFNSDATILTPSTPISATANGAIPGSGNTYFSSDKNAIVKAINAIPPEGETNYFAGFKQVETILNGYQEQAGRDLIVLFMTDGYPNVNTPSEVGQYQMLAAKYPFASFAGIQYQMGTTILDPIKAVSKEQYHADMTNFSNVLFEASAGPKMYSKFILTDYLNSTKWQIAGIDAIQASVDGQELINKQVTLTQENVNLPSPYGATLLDKITWDLSGIYRSGGKAKLEITVTLKDPASIQENEIIPTNDHSSVVSAIPTDADDPNKTPDENVSTPNSPALKYKYKLNYLPNPPKVQAGSTEAGAGQSIGADACTVENMPNPQDETHTALSTVAFVQTVPTCVNATTGTKYLFKGWQASTHLSKLNADYFLMPDADFTLSATWARPDIAKDMKGKVWESKFLYDKIARLSQGLDTNLDFSQMDLSTSGVYTYDKNSQNHGNLILKPVSEGGPLDQYNGGFLDPQSPHFNPDYVAQDLSGDSNGGNKDIYYFRGKVDNNNVLFANMCWKVVRTTSTGGTKLVYAGIPFNSETNATYNSVTDLNVDKTKLKCVAGANLAPITKVNATIGTSPFNKRDGSPVYAGYIYGDNSYTRYRFFNPPAGTIYANDVSWDGTKYTLIDTVAVPAGGQSDTRPGASMPFYQEIADKYHYTCGSTATSCKAVRYTHFAANYSDYNNNYLYLKNGKNIEQAKLDIYRNTNNSTVKDFIDAWYEGNSTNGLHANEKLKDHADQLEDTVFCDDRTFASGPMKSKDDGLNKVDNILVNSSLFAPSARNPYAQYAQNTVKPSLSCANENDRLRAAQLGAKLGLLTIDEATLAGSSTQGFSTQSYLNISADTWLLSPQYWSDGYAGAFNLQKDGQSARSSVTWDEGTVRPAISLSFTASLIVAGDGTMEKPWVVQ